MSQEYPSFAGGTTASAGTRKHRVTVFSNVIEQHALSNTYEQRAARIRVIILRVLVLAKHYLYLRTPANSSAIHTMNCAPLMR